MTSTATYFKLGVLALASIAALAAIILVLGLRGCGSETTAYHTYFDESVQGLETGSPVKFRGVRIGDVTAIDVAPNGRHVDVTLAISESETRRLQIDRTSPGLRARLGSQGLTGVKFVDIDFFPEALAEELPFEHAKHYIPSQPSIFKGLESGGHAIGRRLPLLLDRVTATLSRLDSTLSKFDDARIPSRMARTLGRIDTAVEQAEKSFEHASEAADAIRDLAEQIERDPDMLLKGRR